MASVKQIGGAEYSREQESILERARHTDAVITRSTFTVQPSPEVGIAIEMLARESGMNVNRVMKTLLEYALSRAYIQNKTIRVKELCFEDNG